ncbi:MAG: hypothetical protein ABJH72_13535 [Reichenbachiella sp.]|uniref:hypothetical protein n=1 Tax=Reichenbachiella sp. TaxID=2184521 RepID=UPI0032632B59
MKRLLYSFILLLPLVSYSQEVSTVVNIDSLDKVIIIDHQNFNYEWYCGRRYEIVRNNHGFEMRQVEQYSSPYSFGQTDKTIENDSLDFDNMKTLEALGISVDEPDTLIELANKVISTKQSYWAQKITMANSMDTVKITSFDPDVFIELISAVNDKKSRSITSIPNNLGIDSIWISNHGERLFNLYKLEDVEPTPDQKKYCLSCFRDPKKRMIAIASAVHGHPNTYDYPFVELQFIEKRDTLFLSTDIPNPYSIPWLLNDSTKYFNPKISVLAAELLPDLEYSNKKRLSGNFSSSHFFNSLEKAFAKRMIYKYCTEINEKKKRRRKRIYLDQEKTEVVQK